MATYKFEVKHFYQDSSYVFVVVKRTADSVVIRNVATNKTTRRKISITYIRGESYEKLDNLKTYYGKKMYLIAYGILPEYVNDAIARAKEDYEYYLSCTAEAQPEQPATVEETTTAPATSEQLEQANDDTIRFEVGKTYGVVNNAYKVLRRTARYVTVEDVNPYSVFRGKIYKLYVHNLREEKDYYIPCEYFCTQKSSVEIYQGRIYAHELIDLTNPQDLHNRTSTVSDQQAPSEDTQPEQSAPATSEQPEQPATVEETTTAPATSEQPAHVEKTQQEENTSLPEMVTFNTTKGLYVTKCPRLHTLPNHFSANDVTQDRKERYANEDLAELRKFHEALLFVNTHNEKGLKSSIDFYLTCALKTASKYCMVWLVNLLRGKPVNFQERKIYARHTKYNLASNIIHFFKKQLAKEANSTSEQPAPVEDTATPEATSEQPAPALDEQAIENVYNATVLKMKDMIDAGKNDMPTLWDFHKSLNIEQAVIDEVFKRLQEKGYFQSMAGTGRSPTFCISDLDGFCDEVKKITALTSQPEPQQPKSTAQEWAKKHICVTYITADGKISAEKSKAATQAIVEKLSANSEQPAQPEEARNEPTQDTPKVQEVKAQPEQPTTKPNDDPDDDPTPPSNGGKKPENEQDTPAQPVQPAPVQEVKPARVLPTPKSRKHIFDFSKCADAKTLRNMFKGASIDTVKFIAESYREFQPDTTGKRKDKKFYVDAIVNLYFPNEQPEPVKEVKPDIYETRFIPGKFYVVGVSNWRNEPNPNPKFIKVIRRKNDTITVQEVSSYDFQPIFKPVSRKVKQHCLHRHDEKGYYKKVAVREYIYVPNSEDLNGEAMYVCSLCEYHAMFLTEPGYDVDFDETAYSPDYQEILAVLDDIPEPHEPDTQPEQTHAPVEESVNMPVVVAQEVKNEGTAPEKKSAPVKNPRQSSRKATDDSRQILICFDEDNEPANVQHTPAPAPKQKKARRTSRRKLTDNSRQIFILFPEDISDYKTNQRMAA